MDLEDIEVDKKVLFWTLLNNEFKLFEFHLIWSNFILIYFVVLYQINLNQYKQKSLISDSIKCKTNPTSIPPNPNKTPKAPSIPSMHSPLEIFSTSPKTISKKNPWTSVTKKNNKKSTECAKNTSFKNSTAKNKCSKSKSNNLAVLHLKKMTLASKVHHPIAPNNKVRTFKKSQEETHKVSPSNKIKHTPCQSPKKSTNCSVRRIGTKLHSCSKRRESFWKITNTSLPKFTK